MDANTKFIVALIQDGLRSFDDFRLVLANSAGHCAPASDYFEERGSDSATIDRLLETIADSDGYFSGDARIQAAHFLKSAPPPLLAEREEVILSLYDAEDGDGAGGCLRPMLACLLARFGSSRGLARINEDEEPQRFNEALAAYDQLGEKGEDVDAGHVPQ